MVAWPASDACVVEEEQTNLHGAWDERLQMQLCGNRLGPSRPVPARLRDLSLWPVRYRYCPASPYNGKFTASFFFLPPSGSPHQDVTFRFTAAFIHLDS